MLDQQTADKIKERSKKIAINKESRISFGKFVDSLICEGDSIEEMKEYMEGQGWKFNKEQPND